MERTDNRHAAKLPAADTERTRTNERRLIKCTAAFPGELHHAGLLSERRQNC